jgi:hypothetical protein
MHPRWLIRRTFAPRVAAIACAATLAVTLAGLPLSYLAHQLDSETGIELAASVPFTLVGALLAVRIPRNAIGWILLAMAFVLVSSEDFGWYAVLVFRLGDGGLPLGRIASALTPGWVALVILFPLLLILFPDGRVPSPRWRLPLAAYAVLALAFIVTVALQDLPTLVAHHLRVDSSGESVSLDNPTGADAAFQRALLWPYAVFCLGAVGRLLAGFHGSRGEQRQQWKWLLSGGALSVGSLVVTLVFSPYGGWVGDVASLALLGLLALPFTLGVAILRYRLHEIDRLISRTISYGLLSASLAALVAIVVVVTTRVLPFSSPTAIAAATVVVVLLCNPLRRRLQHLVDRRFNRARYDADATVERFRQRLGRTVELDGAERDLLEIVQRSLGPAQVGLWLAPRGRAG